MKNKIITPNITQIKLQFESTDEMYCRCMWARINLDNDNYSLLAETDCGSYNYSWNVTEDESFLELMCRINKDYLLGKVANENVFDCDETTKALLDYYINDGVYLDDALLEQIKQIYTSSLEGYVEEIKYIDDDNIFNDSDIYECACNKYPVGAITFSEIFEEYVQPLIKGYLEQQHGK